LRIKAVREEGQRKNIDKLEKRRIGGAKVIKQTCRITIGLL
jgi:hypothetical protein